MKKHLLFFLLIFLSLAFFGSAQNAKIDSLLSTLKTSKADTSELILLGVLSREYINISDYDMARKYAERGVTLADKILEEPFMKQDVKRRNICFIDKANVLDDAGISDLFQGKFDESIKNFSLALRLRETVGQKRSIASSYLLIGNVYYSKSDFESAAKNYSDALKIYQEMGERTNIRVAYGSLGNIYFSQGRYVESLKMYFDALKVSEEIGDRKGVASAYSEIGVIYTKQGHYADALDKHFAALKIFKETGLKIRIASTYAYIGKVYQSQGKYDEALKNYFDALKIREEIGEKAGVAASYYDIAVTYNSLHNNPGVLKNVSASLKIGEEIGNKDGVANCYLTLGEYNMNVGNYKEGLLYLNKSLDLARQIDEKNILREVYARLSVAYDSLKDFRNAYEYQKLYTQLKDTMLNEQSSNQINEMKTRYETEKKDKEIELLNKDNDIKTLLVKQNQSSLLAAKLESEKRQNEIALLNKTGEVKDAELKKQKAELEKRHLDAQVRENQVKLLDNEKKLQVAEIGKQKILKNLLIVIFVLLVLFGLLAFNRFRQVQLKKQHSERERISRDLHDDIGSTLGSISMYAEVAKKRLSGPDDVLQKIGESSREMMESMNDIVWAVNPKNDSFEQLVNRMKSFAAIMLAPCEINFNFEVNERLLREKLRMEERRNVFLIYKEAIHNIVKYSACKNVIVRISQEGKKVKMEITDDGKGFVLSSQKYVYNGNGLTNMMTRAKQIGGEFVVESGLGNGTTINLMLKA